MTSKPTARKEFFHIVAAQFTSANDGDTHFISASKLANLYQLEPDEWKSCHGANCQSPIIVRHLYPSYEGKYGRPKS